MEDQRLGQGRSQRQLDNNARSGGCVVIMAITILLWLAVFALFGCGSSQYGYRNRVTDPPIYLIAEIPGIKIIQPQGRKTGKEPKQRKINYILPEYKRITDYTK